MKKHWEMSTKIALVVMTVFVFTFASQAYAANATTGDAIDLKVAVVDPGTSITLPLVGTYTGVTINWGDGTSGSGLNHIYAAPGTYQIQVSAPATGAVGFGITNLFAVAWGWEGSDLVTEVTEWNNLTTLKGAFSGSYQLTSVPNYLPSTVTDISWMFHNATAFNQDISTWNTSNIITLDQTFSGAESFNQPIGNWNTANVTSLVSTFEGAISFNQNVSAWNTSRVTNLQSTFAGATVFNQPLATWNTAQVTSMANTFSGASSFNQSLSAWSTANVTLMPYTFYGATAFNQPLASWNVSRVTDMSYMFNGATSFNQSLSTWVPISVNLVDFMFQGARSFDQSLGALPFKSVYPVSLGRMLTGSSIGASNLSDTLQGWARGWTVAGTSYRIPNSVTTSWRLKYVSDAATTSAITTLTSTNRWNLASETAAYLVTFGAGTGSGTPPTQLAVSLGSSFILPSNGNLAKAGYGFSGWSNGIATYATGATYPAGSSPVNLTALWTASALQVTLQPQNGSPAYTLTTHTDEPIASAPTQPTRTGYQFAGWFTGASGGTAIQFPYTHGQTANFTLYAQWTALPQSVTYSIGPGSGTTPVQNSVPSESRFQLASETGISRVGYSFAGWSDGNQTYAASTSYLAGTSPILLTAQWSANSLLVTIDARNGVASSTITTHTDEQIAAAPTQPNRTGYQFLGWFTSASGGTAIQFPYTHGQTANFTLYAQWTALPNEVRYSIGPASGSTPTQNAVFTGGTFTVANSTGFSRAGYSFEGWVDDFGQSYRAGDRYTATGGAISLSAVWRFIPVTRIGFDSNGGEGAGPQPMVLASGSTLTLIGSMGLTKPGYQLIGWNLGTRFIAVGEPFKLGFDDFTLKAVWEKLAPAEGHGDTGNTYPGTEHANQLLSKLPNTILFGSSSKSPDATGAKALSQIFTGLKAIPVAGSLIGTAQFVLGSKDSRETPTKQKQLLKSRLAYLGQIFAKYGLGIRFITRPASVDTNNQASQLSLTLATTSKPINAS